MRVWRSVVLFITFFVLSLNCATAEDPNFDFGGKAGKTYAIVSGETFKLNVEIGTKEDYPEPKMVKLLIDGCVIELKAEVDSDVDILYTIKEDGKARSPVNNVKLISVKNSDIVMFREKTSTKTECPVNFGNKTGNKYYIPVELSCDVPTSFKLSSTTSRWVNHLPRKILTERAWAWDQLLESLPESLADSC